MHIENSDKKNEDLALPINLNDSLIQKNIIYALLNNSRYRNPENFNCKNTKIKSECRFVRPLRYYPFPADRIFSQGQIHPSVNPENIGRRKRHGKIKTSDYICGKRIFRRKNNIIPNKIQPLCILEKSVCGFHFLVPPPGIIRNRRIIIINKSERKIAADQFPVNSGILKRISILKILENAVNSFLIGKN